MSCGVTKVILKFAANKRFSSGFLADFFGRRLIVRGLPNTVCGLVTVKRVHWLEEEESAKGTRAKLVAAGL